jgi:hypothetical protein
MKLYVLTNGKPPLHPEALTTDNRAVVSVYPEPHNVFVGSTQHETHEALLASIGDTVDAIYVRTGKDEKEYACFTPRSYAT